MQEVLRDEKIEREGKGETYFAFLSLYSTRTVDTVNYC